MARTNRNFQLVAVGEREGGQSFASIFKTATSVGGSVPITLAAYPFYFPRRRLDSSAPSTT